MLLLLNMVKKRNWVFLGWFRLPHITATITMSLYQLINGRITNISMQIRGEGKRKREGGVNPYERGAHMVHTGLGKKNKENYY